MQNSVRKYFEKPVVEQTSAKFLKDIQMPTVYICQDSQFNWLKSSPVGYESFARFTMGQVGYSDNLTWTGKYRNTSFKSLQQEIFDVNYTDFKMEVSDSGNFDDMRIVETEMIYIAPHGFCRMLKNTHKRFYVQATKKSFLILVDPAKKNNIRILKMENGIFELGTIEHGFYESYFYEVHLHIHDKRIHNGISCTDYDRIHSSYGDCIETAMKQNFLNWYNCLPPWLSTNTSLVCEQGKTLSIPVEETFTFIENEFISFHAGHDLKSLEHCLPPCIAMGLKSEMVNLRSKRLFKSYINIKMMNEVVVHTDTFAYDVFSLVVDLGSALGLWLGLSAISIFDYMLEMYEALKQKQYTK